MTTTRISKAIGWGLLLTLALTMAACRPTGKARQQVEDYRQAVRRHFYKQKLKNAQAELAETDSLLQQTEADSTTINVEHALRQDSLKLESDVQGAKIRYIHRKQKELQ